MGLKSLKQLVPGHAHFESFSSEEKRKYRLLIISLSMAQNCGNTGMRKALILDERRQSAPKACLGKMPSSQYALK